MGSEISSRLRWSCRRGMLELDVLLNHFLENVYETLSEAEKKIFVKLLDCSDQDLFEWFMSKKIPTDPEIALMVDKIREHARNRH